MNRRQFLARSGVTLAGALLAACAGGSTATPTATPAPTRAPATSPTTAPAAAASPTTSASTPSPASQPTPTTGVARSTTPFKIGVIAALTGDLAASGKRHVDGMQLALDELGGKAGGRQLQLLAEDSAGSPQQAVAKVRRLVESEHVDAITGFTITPELTANRDYLHQNQQLTLVSTAGWPDLTRNPTVRSPYIFRTSFCQGQYEYILAQWAYDKGGFRSVAFMAPDYSTGHATADVFRTYFKKAGGQVTTEVYPPLNTQDFGPYFQRLSQSIGDAKAVWTWFIGADAIRFMTQFQDFGLKDKYTVLSTAEVGDEPYLKEVGDAALNIISAINYAARYDRAENKAFVDRFQAKYNRLPGHLEYWGYITVMILAKALDAVSGDTSNKDAFLQAIRNVRFQGPMNEVHFHPEAQGLYVTVVVRKVQKLADGTLGNVVVADYPNVHDLSF
ncbi:ABC transporter substrate-binding protein [Thermorudis peleae]|uniref:ABC transporter substrate-binding protein n=1 Tax=Thermorudis peleae TaxID=1382356 RepID=UPI00056F4151|nr:ABC transporter substrate-binding protein [Thermorudis peleae]